jgi:hypothetical protein
MCAYCGCIVTRGGGAAVASPPQGRLRRRRVRLVESRGTTEMLSACVTELLPTLITDWYCLVMTGAG